ncbi:MAG: mRNA-degrading endonuclease [Gemmatimonadales bacterium]|nr:mRNA-degrading endonuclease [Gemmatimonadales bacterium]
MVVPDRGDLVWVSIRPRAENASLVRRPALVVSPARYNERAGLALMCAVSGAATGYPFEVPLPDGLPVSGVVLADHLRSADWRARRASLACRVPAKVVADVLAKLKPL